MTEFKYLFSPITLGPDGGKGYAALERSRFAHHQIFHPFDRTGSPQKFFLNDDFEKEVLIWRMRLSMP
jgi:hypothetical protein